MRSAEEGRSTVSGVAISVAAATLGGGLAVLTQLAQLGRMHPWIAVTLCVAAGIAGGRRPSRGVVRDTFFLVLAAETGYLAVAFAYQLFTLDERPALPIPTWESWLVAVGFVAVGALWLAVVSGAMAFLIRRPVRG